jgi:hypothetical protein
MNSQNPYETRQPKAFISCSLREEDRAFVDYVVRIVGLFGFRPVGTVGKYDAAPKPIWQLMKENIKSADCIILVATPRYLQQDIRDKRDTGKAMSELLHTEVGMAVAMERPVLAFVLEGTNVGNFLPQAVQYITLNPQSAHDLLSKWPLIGNYCRSARAMIQERWLRENRSNFGKGVLWTLAAIGGAVVVNYLMSDNDDDAEDEYDDDED